MPTIVDVPGHGEVEFPDGMNDDQISAAIKKNLLVPKAAPKGSGFADAIGSAVNTVSEPLVAMATGTAGQIAGGLAGIGGAIMPGPPGQAADVAQRVSQAMTYEPRSAGARAVMGTIAKPFEWLSGKAKDAGNYTLDKTGSPALATAVDTGINMLPMAAGGVISRSGIGAEAPAVAAARNARKSMNSVKDATIADARAEGYVVPPSAVEPSFFGNKIESLGGKAAIRQEAELRNQQVTNTVARREAGLAPDQPLSEATLSAARDVIAQPYREVAALSPRAASSLEKLKETRAEAKDYWRHYDRSADPKSLKEAKALDAKAELYEKVIDAEAKRSGRSDLLQQVQDARTALAKNYDVERALNIGSGDVDAQVIGRLLDRKGVNAMSGGLQTVGKFANAFRPYARDAAMVPTPGVSKIAPIMSAALGVGGNAAFGPAGLLAAGLPLLDAPARSLMLSKLMQGGRTYNRSALSFAKEEAARKAGILGLMGQSTE